MAEPVLETDSSDARDAAVVEFLAAVILEGWRKADAVAALAATTRGQDSEPPMEAPSIVAADEVPAGPIADLVSGVGAALRIAQWERAGLRPFLPAELPAAVDAFRSILHERQDLKTHQPADLADVQLSVWLKHFAWHAGEILGSEIVQFGCPIESEALIDRLAEFLWAHRHGVPDVPEKN